MEAKIKNQAKRIWKEWIRPFLIILVALGSFRSAVADWNDVPTGSMKPSILEGDRIFVNKLAFGLRVPFTSWRIADWSEPQRGDIVVFHAPDDGVRMVKRVVGVPGDVIELRNNELWVNGNPARYGTIESEIWNQMSPGDKAQHSGAVEVIGTVNHPVMTLNGFAYQSSFPPTVIPDGQFFMMGDNRDNSRDSRWYGAVDRSLIVGRALAVAVSFDINNYYVPRWARFFTELP